MYTPKNIIIKLYLFLDPSLTVLKTSKRFSDAHSVERVVIFIPINMKN